MAKRKKTRWESEADFARRKRRMVPRGLRAPVPYRLSTKLRYSTTLALNPGLGSVPAVHVLSANGLYDPDITGVGGQPRGFDQLMALYDHCVCTYTTIDCLYMPADSETAPMTVAVAARDFTTVGTSVADYTELSNSAWDTLSAIQGYKTRVKMNLNPNVYLGRTKPLSDPDLKNSSLSNPTEQVYWHVTATAGFTGGDPGTVAVLTVIEYTVVFIEPKDPGAS